ncbi:MAG: hypothetical protein LBR66_05615 [Candidatus Symbiothrix sp.]|jgi:gliding motility-associated lipoprotein GldD|nr:hypothetical protein [Candidatus Symbiothrix sp.]
MTKRLIYALAMLLSTACTHYAPKPTGYFRISMPEANYHSEQLKDKRFLLSNQAHLELSDDDGQTLFFNIVYPNYRANIYGCHKTIRPEDLSTAYRDTRELTLRQAIYNQQITEREYNNAEKHVYGNLFCISGQVASPTQFVLTDSLHYFVRGALYFEQAVNADSIAPVLEFINNDIKQLMTSFE